MAVGSQFFLTRSALLALRSDSSFSPLLVETKELIRKAEEDNIIIDLCWVPGHVNVQGNEKADAAALRALKAPHKAIPHTDMRRPSPTGGIGSGTPWLEREES